MQDQFSRLRMLLGEDGISRLRNSRVAVFGLGGVGSYAVEALARSGIGALDLIDPDVYTLTNLNRQLFATARTLGRPKAEVAAERVLEINPACRVTPRCEYYLPDTASLFDFSRVDYIVDAVDTVTAKLLMAQKAQEAGTRIISAMGTGNKLDPSLLKVGDISETAVCPLARIMRSECRKRGIRQLKVVWSEEPPLRPLPEEAPDSEGHSAAGGIRRDTPGSSAFVPAAAGLIIASEVVRDLLRSREET